MELQSPENSLPIVDLMDKTWPSKYIRAAW